MATSLLVSSDKPSKRTLTHTLGLLRFSWPGQDPQEPLGKRILRLSQQRGISEPELARKLGSVAADPGDYMNKVV
jgi:hypothetical protein